MMGTGWFDKPEEHTESGRRPRHSTATHSSLRNLWHRQGIERIDLMPGAEGNWPGADSWA